MQAHTYILKGRASDVNFSLGGCRLREVTVTQDRCGLPSPTLLPKEKQGDFIQEQENENELNRYCSVVGK